MKRTFTPKSMKPGFVLAPVTGEQFDYCGVPLVVHRPVYGLQNAWDVTEPTSGSSVARHASTKSEARELAARNIELAGGIGALLYCMAMESTPAQCSGRTGLTGVLVSGRHLAGNFFRYGPGGPLDAPDLMPAGAMYWNYGPEARLVAR